jgi:hypothetical protein
MRRVGRCFGKQEYIVAYIIHTKEKRREEKKGCIEGHRSPRPSRASYHHDWLDGCARQQNRRSESKQATEQAARHHATMGVGRETRPQATPPPQSREFMRDHEKKEERKGKLWLRDVRCPTKYEDASRPNLPGLAVRADSGMSLYPVQGGPRAAITARVGVCLCVCVYKVCTVLNHSYINSVVSLSVWVPSFGCARDCTEG